MTLEQAEKTFTGQSYRTPQMAVEESLRGTQDPKCGYYTLGKLMILKLRSDYKKMMGSAYTPEKFHDELLSRGDRPVPLLRPYRHILKWRRPAVLRVFRFCEENRMVRSRR